MTDEAVSPFDDNAPDLEGCADQGHCHRKRSARQPDAVTEEGRIKACHRPAGWGTAHVGEGACKLHGGSTRNYMKKVEKDRAEAAMVTLGLPEDVDPSEALLKEVQRTAGHVAWIGRVIQSMESEDLVWGMTEEVLEPEIRDSDGQTITQTVSGKYKAQASVWYELYSRERRHLANVCKIALDAGVNERLVRMYEQAGDTFAAMMERVMDHLDLTDEQRRRVPAAVVRELRALTGDG